MQLEVILERKSLSHPKKQRQYRRKRKAEIVYVLNKILKLD